MIHFLLTIEFQKNLNYDELFIKKINVVIQFIEKPCSLFPDYSCVRRTVHSLHIRDRPYNYSRQHSSRSSLVHWLSKFSVNKFNIFIIDFCYFKILLILVLSE